MKSLLNEATDLFSLVGWNTGLNGPMESVLDGIKELTAERDALKDRLDAIKDLVTNDRIRGTDSDGWWMLKKTLLDPPQGGERE